jgi:hypothetical protein
MGDILGGRHVPTRLAKVSHLESQTECRAQERPYVITPRRDVFIVDEIRHAEPLHIHAAFLQLPPDD